MGIVGFNAGDMTYRELVWAATGRLRSDWNRTADVLAMLHNCHRSEETPVATRETYHPLRLPTPPKSSLPKAPITAFKVFLRPQSDRQ